ncbi:MAG TPA: hypothetical protein VKU00_17845 [Chthonomonadaceae bacterium]|nr:hypothetical protein [Chthonomonadaceae bacterium]
MQLENESGLYFVYRTHYEGPLSKRIKRLPDGTVLSWFQRGWRVAAEGGDPRAWVEEELGGNVYGLASIFQAVQEEHLPLPKTWQQLRSQLADHLYVEGDEDNIRMDQRSLRVKTDDDEVDLAYYFFEANLVRERPDRLAYLIQEGWALPEGMGSGGFQPVMSVPSLGPIGTGDGACYCVLLIFSDSDSFDTVPHVFPGVRLPELAAYMRAVTPQGVERRYEGDVWEDTWPLELLVLRTLLEPEEDNLHGALERCNLWPAFAIEQPSLYKALDDPSDYPTDHRAILEFRERFPAKMDRDPAATLIQYTPHMAQMCIHMSSYFGYQQWFFFDDLWASAHPDLAQSLLWYASTWDILQDSVTVY